MLAFLYIPIALICLYAFNSSNVQSWPIAGLTTKWFSPAIHNGDMQQALWLSLKAGALATAIALVLGSVAAFGVHRFRFFGRESISFLLVLPIALPGIITGMALNSYFTFWKFNFGLWTIVIGHATFCVVVVYNNVVARLRRVPGSLTEASMDLGADGWQTFRYVTFPSISTALISGGLLAFALSFDEVIVTTFTAGAQNTLPIWIFGQIRLGQQLPQVNVVVLPDPRCDDHPRRARAAPDARERDPSHRIGECTWQPSKHHRRPEPGDRRDDRAACRTCRRDEVDAAVERAKHALPGWLDATPGERAELLLKLADVTRGQRRGARADRVAQRRQAALASRATRCRSPPTTSASSRARRGTSKASRRASTSRATRRWSAASRSGSSPGSARGTTR